MTTNFHTAITVGAAANASTINDPLAELDSAITDIDFTYSGIGTEYLDGNAGFSVPVGTGASVDGHAVTEEGGADLPQRAKMDFIGASVVATNGVSATEITIDGGKLDKNTETLAGTKTLTDASEKIQYLDPDGVHRDVNLPAEAATNPFFVIVNTAGGAENLVVKDDSPATILTLNQNESGWFVCDGVTWKGFLIENADTFMADLVDDASPQFGGSVDMNGNAFSTSIPIEATRPVLSQKDAANTAEGRFATYGTGPYVTANLYFDGADWQSDDVTLSGSIMQIGQAVALQFRYAPAGANPRTGALVEAFRIDGTNGFLGINQNNPADRVHQVGNHRIEAGQLYIDKQTLTPGVNVDWNIDLGAVAELTLGQNTTMNAPTNIKTGGPYYLKVINGASWTLDWNAVFDFPRGVVPMQIVGAAEYDIYRFISYDGTNLEAASDTNPNTPRVSTEASSATPTINTDYVDAHSITALAAAITSMTTNLSGTPVDFQKLIIRILDDGTARAITWGADFQDSGVALPTTTVISKILTVGFIYDAATANWGCVAVADET